RCRANRGARLESLTPRPSSLAQHSRILGRWFLRGSCKETIDEHHTRRQGVTGRPVKGGHESQVVATPGNQGVPYFIGERHRRAGERGVNKAKETCNGRDGEEHRGTD